MTNNSHFPPKKVKIQNEWNTPGLLSTLEWNYNQTETTSSNKKQMERATVISQDI